MKIRMLTKRDIVLGLLYILIGLTIGLVLGPHLVR